MNQKLRRAKFYKTLNSLINKILNNPQKIRTASQLFTIDRKLVRTKPEMEEIIFN